MIAERSHRAGLAPDARQAGIVEALDLDECQRDVPPQPAIVSEVDALAAALAEEAAYFIAPTGKRGGGR
jgi:hypothetical protein